MPSIAVFPGSDVRSFSNVTVAPGASSDMAVVFEASGDNPEFGTTSYVEKIFGHRAAFNLAALTSAFGMGKAQTPDDDEDDGGGGGGGGEIRERGGGGGSGGGGDGDTEFKVMEPPKLKAGTLPELDPQLERTQDVHVVAMYSSVATTLVVAPENGVPVSDPPRPCRGTNMLWSLLRTLTTEEHAIDLVHAAIWHRFVAACTVEAKPIKGSAFPVAQAQAFSATLMPPGCLVEFGALTGPTTAGGGPGTCDAGHPGPCTEICPTRMVLPGREAKEDFKPVPLSSVQCLRVISDNPFGAPEVWLHLGVLAPTKTNIRPLRLKAPAMLLPPSTSQCITSNVYQTGVTNPPAGDPARVRAAVFCCVATSEKPAKGGMLVCAGEGTPPSPHALALGTQCLAWGVRADGPRLTMFGADPDKVALCAQREVPVVWATGGPLGGGGGGPTPVKPSWTQWLLPQDMVALKAMVAGSTTLPVSYLAHVVAALGLTTLRVVATPPGRQPQVLASIKAPALARVDPWASPHLRVVQATARARRITGVVLELSPPAPAATEAVTSPPPCTLVLKLETGGANHEGPFQQTPLVVNRTKTVPRMGPVPRGAPALPLAALGGLWAVVAVVDPGAPAPVLGGPTTFVAAWVPTALCVNFGFGAAPCVVVAPGSHPLVATTYPVGVVEDPSPGAARGAAPVLVTHSPHQGTQQALVGDLPARVRQVLRTRGRDPAGAAPAAAPAAAVPRDALGTVAAALAAALSFEALGQVMENAVGGHGAVPADPGIGLPGAMVLGLAVLAAATGPTGCAPGHTVLGADAPTGAVHPVWGLPVARVLLNNVAQPQPTTPGCGDTLHWTPVRNAIKAADLAKRLKENHVHRLVPLQGVASLWLTQREAAAAAAALTTAAAAAGPGLSHLPGSPVKVPLDLMTATTARETVFWDVPTAVATSCAMAGAPDLLQVLPGGWKGDQEGAPAPVAVVGHGLGSMGLVLAGDGTHPPATHLLDFKGAEEVHGTMGTTLHAALGTIPACRLPGALDATAARDVASYILETGSTGFTPRALRTGITTSVVVDPTYVGSVARFANAACCNAASQFYLRSDAVRGSVSTIVTRRPTAPGEPLEVMYVNPFQAKPEVGAAATPTPKFVPSLTEDPSAPWMNGAVKCTCASCWWAATRHLVPTPAGHP